MDALRRIGIDLRMEYFVVYRDALCVETLGTLAFSKQIDVLGISFIHFIHQCAAD